MLFMSHVDMFVPALVVISAKNYEDYMANLT